MIWFARKYWIKISLVLFFAIPAICLSATPTISNVSGTVSNGQTLTITGANLTDENTSPFHSFFSYSPTTYGFEGTSPTANGYTTSTGGSGSTVGYVTDIKLSGNKSIKFHAQGYYGPEGYPNQFIAGGNAYWGTPITTNLYVRQYVRYSLNGGVWPGMGPKMTWYEAVSGLYDLAPEPTGGPIPSRWRWWANNTYNVDNPWGQLENNRWYCIEERMSASPRLIELWVDGQKLLSVDPGISPSARWADFGMVNGWDTKTSAFNLDQWVDNLAFSSTQRIYCSSIIEIANSSNYLSATKRYQAPISLNNGEVVVKVDLTTLGAGPYYLFVTNNRQERSAAYSLSGGGGDTTPPTTTINTSDPSAISTDSLTVAGTASDDTGVSGCKWRIGSMPDGSNGTACTGTTSFSCATSGYASGANTLYVGCYDAAGNYGSDSIIVNYTPPDIIPPVISGGSPSGEQAYGTTSVNMQVTTNEAATCKYGTIDVSYASLPNTFATTGGTSHSQSIVTTNGGSYTRYVRCIDGSGNANTTSTVLSWTVAANPSQANTLLSESFENSNWAARSWFDNTNHGQIVSSGCYSGNCLQWAWTAGQQRPTNGTTTRHMFTATDELYITFYQKYDTGWRGSQQTYHPHLMFFLTDQDSEWSGFAYTNLTTYIESLADIGSPYATRMLTSIQDSVLVNSSLGTPPNNLVGVTENRSVASCNGTLGATGTPALTVCYNDGDWNNFRGWIETTQITKGQWQRVEVYFKMNSISGGVAQADGVMKLWVDGSLRINHSNVVYRTNQQPTKKWNLIALGPYIGDGSPITQTMWIDELTVMDGMPDSSNVTILAAPYNFRILN